MVDLGSGIYERLGAKGQPYVKELCPDCIRLIQEHNDRSSVMAGLSSPYLFMQKNFNSFCPRCRRRLLKIGKKLKLEGNL